MFFLQADISSIFPSLNRSTGCGKVIQNVLGDRTQPLPGQAHKDDPRSSQHLISFFGPLENRTDLALSNPEGEEE